MGRPMRRARAETADPAAASSAARVAAWRLLSPARSSNGSGPSNSALSRGASSATDSEGSAAPIPTGKPRRCAIFTPSPIRRLLPIPAAPSISRTAPEPERTRSSNSPTTPSSASRPRMVGPNADAAPQCPHLVPSAYHPEDAGADHARPLRPVRSGDARRTLRGRSLRSRPAKHRTRRRVIASTDRGKNLTRACDAPPVTRHNFTE